VTQEFHISVTPVGQENYLVRTEQVAPGVPLAEELVPWPVADWLAAAGQLMNDPLQSVLQGDAIARNSVNLVTLGKQLYNALFQGTLRDSWITAQGIAQNQQQVLRLRLGLKDQNLARLPWEVMHAGDRPIATGPYIAFSRYQSGLAAASRLPSNISITPEDGIIKVLMVIASPTDQVRLDLLKQEAHKLRTELRRNSDNINSLPEIQLTLLEQPGREELTQALEQGGHHVLHYSGHSNLGANGGEIYLVGSRTGLTETLSGDDLAGLLVNNNIRMAVFNSCLGAYTPSGNASADSGERNLTESLVKRGISSVLAMSERIPDEVAVTLTQIFYRNLSQGYPLDLCVSRVRQGLISAYGSHQTYWALPILYLQPESDGYLSSAISLAQRGELFNEVETPINSPANIFSSTRNNENMTLPPIDDILDSGDVDEDTEDLNWLGHDPWDSLEDDDITYDDPSYQEDSDFISGIFQKIDEEESASKSSSPAKFGANTGFDTSEISKRVNDNNPATAMDNWEMDIFDKVANSSQLPIAANPIPNNTNTLLNNQQVVTEEKPDYSTPNPSISPSKRRNLLPIGAAVGVSILAAVIGFNWWKNSQLISELPPLPPDASPSILVKQDINYKTAETGVVTENAIQKFNRGELKIGLKAVEELLNRNALPNAKAALKMFPQEKNGDALVNFLWGRLAWQSVQTGDKEFSIDDARRYWELAAKVEPESPLYKNALGFAYYAENDINRANASWLKALNLALQPQGKEQDVLTAYAGLALGLDKSSKDLPDDKKKQYLSRVVNFVQTVIQKDPNNFQPEELSKDWLWTEKAINDWKILLKNNR
jgi:CHAT domain-containing protein